ncbi:hypothetical protein ACFO0S_02210 [Chryseomicrobium palamuruense]|uniref:Uncharacterized protein n=1 Tax=Chryseomicrobium palamuruense TaxID=682973 RepID=A0ABV8URY9_9BACL
MKKTTTLVLAAILLAGCGTANGGDQTPQAQEQVKTVEFPKLKQTVSEDLRNEKLHPQEDMGGFPKEVLEIQGQEGQIAMQVLEEVLGGYEGVQEQTVTYFQNETTDTHKIGFYIGMKEEDAKFDQVFDALQQKVDKGEILAKYVHFQPITYSQQELNDTLDELYAKLKFSYIGRKGGHFGMSISPITNVVQVDHNMFTDENQEKIRELFGEWEVEFTQSGAMIPGPGEPLVIFPDEEFTTKPQTGGEIIMFVGEKTVHTYSMHYDFEGAAELKVGMRVDIEPNGPTLASFPGKGGASFVTVYPNYKPEGATLSEFEVNARAIEQLTEEQRRKHPLLESAVYDAAAKSWNITFSFDWEDIEPVEIMIEDK